MSTKAYAHILRFESIKAAGAWLVLLLLLLLSNIVIFVLMLSQTQKNTWDICGFYMQSSQKKGKLSEFLDH